MTKRNKEDRHKDTFQVSHAPAALQDVDTMSADERKAEIERLVRNIAALRSVGKPLDIHAENDTNG